uniref:hypothetical protein n=1 Tax=Salmonella enterica TaxID=28901 RepID=UPI003A8EE5B0
MGKSAPAGQQAQYHDMPSAIASSLVSTALKIYHSENKPALLPLLTKAVILPPCNVNVTTM